MLLPILSFGEFTRDCLPLLLGLRSVAPKLHVLNNIGTKNAFLTKGPDFNDISHGSNISIINSLLDSDTKLYLQFNERSVLLFPSRVIS